MIVEFAMAQLHSTTELAYGLPFILYNMNDLNLAFLIERSRNFRTFCVVH